MSISAVRTSSAAAPSEKAARSDKPVAMDRPATLAAMGGVAAATALGVGAATLRAGTPVSRALPLAIGGGLAAGVVLFPMSFGLSADNLAATAALAGIFALPVGLILGSALPLSSRPMAAGMAIAGAAAAVGVAAGWLARDGA